MTEPSPPDPPGLPLQLRLVAWLNVFLGVSAAGEIVYGLCTGRLSLNFGVLLIPAGLGLRNLRPSWLRFLIGWSKLVLTLAAIAAILILAFPAKETVLNLMGRSRRISSLWAVPALALIAVMHLWQLRVLKSPEVERLFHPPPAA